MAPFGQDISEQARHKRFINRQEIQEGLEVAGIAYHPSLPLIEDSSQATLKPIETICQRAMTALFAIQVACEIINETANIEEARAFFGQRLKDFGLEDQLTQLEKRAFDGTASQQDALNLAWTYEAYWSLVWALGLISEDELVDAGQVCDARKAILLVQQVTSLEDFQSICQLRDIEDILDKLDLFYNYHWACVEHRLRPETPIANLNESIVCERRRGLEWLISPEEDWHAISLNT